MVAGVLATGGGLVFTGDAEGFFTAYDSGRRAQGRPPGTSSAARDTTPGPSPTPSTAGSTSPSAWAGAAGRPGSPATKRHPGLATRGRAIRCSYSHFLEASNRKSSKIRSFAFSLGAPPCVSRASDTTRRGMGSRGGRGSPGRATPRTTGARLARAGASPSRIVSSAALGVLDCFFCRVRRADHRRHGSRPANGPHGGPYKIQQHKYLPGRPHEPVGQNRAVPRVVGRPRRAGSRGCGEGRGAGRGAASGSAEAREVC